MTKQSMFSLTTVVLLLSFVSTSWSVYYVDADNPSPALPYSSWSSAATSIQEAIDLAEDGATVLVTNGTYYLSTQISVTKDIRIESVNGPYETIVNGNNVCRGFNLGSNECVVSGFTVTNCNAGTSSAANNGGGFVCTDNTPIITNCVITANVGHDGGGLRMGTACNCVISGNQTSWSGAGGHFTDMNNCLVVNNSAGFRGGGVSNGELLNCTIVGNYASGDGNGLFMCSATNCIIYYNNGEDVYWESNPYYQSSVGYSCGSDLTHGGEGNITAVPNFIDPDNGNYRLLSTSPCINAGLNSAATTDPDLDGAPRIQQSTVDMGAYEYDAHDSGNVPGLIAYYPLDGDANDASGNGYDGEISNAVFTATGVIGGAYSFDGEDDFIDLPHIMTGMQTNFSFSVWIYPRKVLNDKYEIIVHRASWHDVDLQINNDEGNGKLMWRIHDENSSLYDVHKVFSDSQLETQTWYHVVGTYDGRQQKLYINGDLQADVLSWHEDKVDFDSGYKGTWIGKMDGHSGSFHYHGVIDEIRVYNRALSASEVQTLYNQPSDVDVDGLPNDWEDLYFGSERGAEPGDDPDGDGFDNLEEFEQDTDPHRFDIGEVTICTTPGIGGPMVNIGWNSVSGTNYVVEWTASLESNDWEEVDSVTGGADGDESVIDPRGTSQGYYRIVLP